MKCDAVVVGGGLAGLVAAWELSRRGLEVVLLEGAARAGGYVRTSVVDGYRLEHGPTTVPARGAFLELVGTLGLSGALVPALEGARHRYVVRGGRPVALPSGAWDLVRGRALGPLAALALLREPFVRRGRVSDESVAAFTRRRLGRAWLDYAIEPFVGGTFAGDVGALEMRSAFRRVVALEDEAGSLARGGLRRLVAGRARKRTGVVDGPARGLATLAGGLENLVRALALALATRVRLGAPVAAIEPVAGAWRVALATGESYTARGVVVASPAPVAALLLAPWAGDIARGLAAIPHAPLAVVHVGVRAGDLARPLDGFGVLVPRVERAIAPGVLGILVPSRIFPGVAPDGHEQLACYLGGATAPEYAQLDDAAMMRAVVLALERLMGLTGSPRWLSIARHSAAIPQYVRGHARHEASLAALEGVHPGLAIVGFHRGGIGVGDVISTARAGAARVSECRR